jgi:hypothetical protein
MSPHVQPVKVPVRGFDQVIGRLEQSISTSLLSLDGLLFVVCWLIVGWQPLLLWGLSMVCLRG